MKNQHLQQVVPWDAFLDELYYFIPTGKNGKWYIDAVLEAAHRRRAILGYEELAKAARDAPRPIEEFDPEKLFVDPTGCDPQVLTVNKLFGFDREKDGTSRFGKRWLCQGDSLVISDPTGIGKSAFAMQMVVCWALGRPFFGIVTAGPLRILLIQSENNLGDLAIPFQDICDRIKISDQDKKRLAEQMVFARESEKTGDAFIAAVDDVKMSTSWPYSSCPVRRTLNRFRNKSYRSSGYSSKGSPAKVQLSRKKSLMALLPSNRDLNTHTPWSRCQIFFQLFKVVYLVRISSPDSGAADSIRKSMCFSSPAKEQETKNGQNKYESHHARFPG